MLDVAPQLADHARLAEALSSAVAARPYACRDAGTAKATKRAFMLLHKRFPTSPWAKRTPHYY